ncbi:MAG: translation initiation factor IF-3 [Chloroflexi bacterium]|nr:translation initiation factor IF-3 [Chloroflexota bacterium]MYD47180.1 translation initiation factor IF-3 [Chloroflexota bacterium]
MARQYRVNEQIRVPQVRVIGEDGEQLGVMTVSDALSRARMHDLDLVEVAPNADPPVARLLDYGKLRYLTSKKERETRKSQKSNELKEVRFRPNIGTHDFDAKMRKVKQFIGNGDKVKLTVRFRGREAVHQQNGLSLLKKVAEEMKDEIRLEQQPSMEGRAMSMVLIPSPAVAARQESNSTATAESE